METTTTCGGSTTVVTVGQAPNDIEVVIRCNYESPLWFEDLEPDTRERAKKYPNQYRIVKIPRAQLEAWRAARRAWSVIQREIDAAYESGVSGGANVPHGTSVNR